MQDMVTTQATTFAGPPPYVPSPCEAEPFDARLLLEAALRLQAVQTRWDDSWDNNKEDAGEALRYTRELWGRFITAMSEPDPMDTHPLPTEVRQTISNLGLFVIHQTLAIAADPHPEKLTTLIGINREIAAGLLQRA